MATEQPIDDRMSLEHEPELDKLLRAAIKTRASDLHLKVGQPPKLDRRIGLRDTQSSPEGVFPETRDSGLGP
jgi:hypothetical protein